MKHSHLTVFVLLLLRWSTATAEDSEVPSADVEITQNGTAIAGDTSFSLSCRVTLPQCIELTVEILKPATINATDYSINRMNDSVIDGNCTYTSVLRFTILKTSHGGEYTCTVTLNSNTIASDTIVKVQIPPPAVSVAPADNDLVYYAGSSLILTCTISLDGMLVDNLTGITVNSSWTGPHGKLYGSHNRISVTDATESTGDCYSSTVVFTHLHTSDTGNYSCDARISHMSEFIVSSNPGTNQVIISVKAPNVTVIITLNPVNGEIIAGDMSFITCMVNGTEDLQASLEFTLTSQDNTTLLNTNNTHLHHSFTARASDAGMYICKVTVTSAFLDAPIISNATVTLTVQIPTPVLTMSRVPDASVTLRHGDHLNLTCTIKLDPAVDIAVYITGTLSGQGIENPIFDAAKHIPSREHQINRTIASLEAARSTDYTCNATVSPGPGVVNVEDSQKNCSVLNITVELNVTISVSYTPPPGVDLGPNEYRAASGPVTVTCTVTGGTGDISYRWSSDCRRCDFQTKTSGIISRGAVYSGDTGVHTCTATTTKSVGSASINFTVKGAGIHVFRGIPTGSFVNNSLVSLNPMDTMFRLRLVCRSDSVMINAGKLIGLDGRPIATHNSSFFNISNPQPGELYVENIANSIDLTASGQGVYTCRIPLQSGGMTDINIGIYPSGFTAPPQITNLTFTNEPSSSFLTCTSTGFPATNVTWMRDGQPLTINGSTYQLTQTVTNRAESSYENVLTINEELSAVVEHHYSCIVSNERGYISRHLNLTANPLNVAIMQQVNPTPGGSFSLNCSLTLPRWAKALEEPTVQFLNPVNIADDSYIAIEKSQEVSSSSFKYITTLKFTTLQISHGGQYKCQAGFRSQTAENVTYLVVKIPTPILTMSRDPDASVTLRHGDPLILTCIIELDPAVDIDVKVTGTLSGQGIQTPNFSSVIRIPWKVYQIQQTIASLIANRSAIYTCTATVSPASRDGSVLNSQQKFSMLNVTIDLAVTITVSYIPPPGVVLDLNEYRAASGPVIVTCTVVGRIPIAQYQWSSTCRDCPFQESQSNSIFRAAVHSGDTGIHTCTATDTTGNTGMNTTRFIITGAGIHVFRGIPTGSFSNNSLVSLNPVDMEFRLQFFCRSDSMVEDVGKFIGLDGSPIVTHNSSFFNISNSQPGELYVENIANSTDLTASGQGVYTCRIPLQSGGMMDINIGIYPSGFTAPLQITNLAFTDGSSSSFLTCTSTGSPATTVTWMRDGQPLTIDGSTYQLTQTVTNRAESSYENVLTVKEELSAVVEHHYSCIVSNERGNASRHLNLTVKPLNVAIMQQVNPTPGGSFSLSCSLTLPRWAKALEEPTVQFLNPVNIADDSYIAIEKSQEVSISSFKYITTLKFTTLQISHGGQYKCQAGFRSQTAENVTYLVVKIPTPILTMSRDPDASVTLRHGDPLILTCIIELDPAVDIDVKVTGTLSGQGIQTPNFSSVIRIPRKVYQIQQTIASLIANRSAIYTCTATVSPASRDGSVLNSQQKFSMLNVTIDLAVTITVSYIPPPGVMLGLNEYRAASGPVIVTCRAMGQIPITQYQWSSTCRDCPFQESQSNQIVRAAVHSGDTGIHTCTATDTTGNTGMNSTRFIITGAGIHVFNGVPKGSLQSNELVVSDDSDSKFHLRFFCRSDSMSNNARELIGLHNSTLTNSRPLNISTPQPGELLVFVDNHTHLTPSHQGVYTCRISMQNGDIKEINIGIYPSGFKSAPTVASVVYRLERSSSDLTCNSITSPPSTVTWVLADAMFTLRDGESVTINRVKYELKQTVTNRTTSAYASTLTINTTLAGDTTEYRCTVNNALGSDTKTVGEGTFSISIFPKGTQTAGENCTLTCSIAVAKGVVDTLTAHWSGPGVHTEGVTATNVSMQTLDNSSTFTLDLIFTPLRQSHDGDYNCTADLAKFTDSYITGVLTAVPLVEVQISGGGVVNFGESVALNCTISGVDNLDGIITFQWRGPNGTRLESTSPQLVLSTVSFSDAGIYTCTATVSSPYLNEDILENDTVNVNVSVPSPDVAIDHDGRSTIDAGSVLVLPCTITLDRRVAQNELLIVTTMWTGPHGELENETRVTVMKKQGTSGQYISNVIFNTIHVGDSGNYSCQANVSHPATQFIHQGMNTSVTTITVQAPNVALSLTPNTTRLPNVHPYNTFSLTCTATAPEGVISPMTFTWWRQNDVMTGNLTEIYDNKTTQIINRALDEPVSTSVLTVTETTAGEWHYQCSVTLMELTNVANEADSHPIRVTGPASPEPPVDLLTDSVTTDSANISWIVSTIAFTPETYVVHYGTNMDTLESDPIVRSNFTAMNNSISITLDDLIPNTVYFYHINSTNSIDSVLSQVANFTTETEASGIPVAAVGGGLATVLSITVLCIVIAGSVWWLRKNGNNKVRSKFQIRSPNALDTMINVELIAVENTKVEEHNIEATTFQDTVRKSILVTEFGNHVSSMHMDDWGFEFEYKTISKEPLASHDTSQIPCNKERNRFVNIYPYDFSRVKLKEVEGVDGSDYINASFIDGYAKQNEYIAAQGPLPETVGDFWRMVWEYKLTTVVMLTRCKEGTKYKCQQYWPDELNQTLKPGFNLVVTLTSLLPFVEYEIRKLTVTDASNPSAPALQVTHLHYVVWPDHGVPTDSTSLINFVRRVRKVQPHSAEVPLLVHCSAGVGRTGTFIAIDIEMQRIEAEGVVDIYGCTKKLRARRVFMVQTETQYVFIHDALNELILCGETDIPAASLLIAINRLGKTVQGKQITGFEEQFEILGQFCANASEYTFSEATHTCNLPKNRYSATVAGSYTRVHLKYTGAPGSDYINANFIGGYRQRGAYIATQGPLASTVKDFWRMMWEHQSKCIVMLCSVQEEGEESCYPYWPEKQGTTETHDKIKVTLLSEEDYGSCIIRKLEVVENNKGAADPAVSEVTQFHFLRWPKYGEPSPPASLLELVENLTRVQMGTGNRAITVMCNDGVGRTGAFICLHAQLERLKAEGVVDIFQFIKSARLSRPGLVQNVGQYVLCHKVLADFMNSFETYANFKELV